MAFKENIKTGKKYRIKVGENEWDTQSFWHKASDTECNDGKSVEGKLGAINGISSSSTANADDIAASTKLVNQLNQHLGGIKYDAEKDAIMLYRNGKWNYWKKCYSTKYEIFMNGTWAENLTPDFRGAAAGHMEGSGYSASCVNNAITLTFAFHSGGATGKVVLWDMFDLTDYSKLVCVISGRALGNNGWYHFGATRDLGANDNFSLKMDVSSVPLNTPVELNISSLSGEYYIGFSHYHQDWDKSIVIPLIYLIA